MQKRAETWLQKAHHGSPRGIKMPHKICIKNRGLLDTHFHGPKMAQDVGKHGCKAAPHSYQHILTNTFLSTDSSQHFLTNIFLPTFSPAHSYQQILTNTLSPPYPYQHIVFTMNLPLLCLRQILTHTSSLPYSYQNHRMHSCYICPKSLLWHPYIPVWAVFVAKRLE